MSSTNPPTSVQAINTALVPSYTTSKALRSAMSSASSIRHHPRGLEPLWYTPYHDLLRELVQPLDGTYLVHVQYPLWIPSLQMREMKLKKEFLSMGLPWDTPTPDEEAATPNEDRIIRAARDHLGSTRVQHNTQVRQSQALREKNRYIRELCVKRDDLVKKQNMKENTPELPNTLPMPGDDEDEEDADGPPDDSETQRKSITPNTFSAPEGHANASANQDVPPGSDSQSNPNVLDHMSDISMLSAPSIADGKGFDDFPDFFIEHVLNSVIPCPLIHQMEEDSLLDVHYQYILRGGLKTYHACGSLVGELKTPPSRNLSWTESYSRATLILMDATEELLEYVALYFQIHQEAESIISLCGSGPYWKWREVRRTDIPKWDWLNNEPDPKDSDKTLAYQMGFCDIQILGTKKSDQMMTSIRSVILNISSGQNNGHDKIPTEDTIQDALQRWLDALIEKYPPAEQAGDGTVNPNSTVHDLDNLLLSRLSQTPASDSSSGQSTKDEPEVGDESADFDDDEADDDYDPQSSEV